MGEKSVKLILRYMKRYAARIAQSMGIKLLGAVTELMIPYILEYLIDEVVPLGQLSQAILWGGLMILTALVTRQLNIAANRLAVDNAHNVSYDIRQDLFTRTANLSGAQFDRLGLPSLISRMTSDSYNVQSCVQSLQTMCIRMPILLLGGIGVTMAMDPVLSGILCVIVPVLIVVILTVSRYGIPLYRKVQEKLDDVVRIMREDITGIRVVKALSKTEYEKGRFGAANDAMTRADIKASIIMAIPGPLMQMCLNTGLTLVVWIGAGRVNSGQIKPGVILAFLTYFNMVMQGVMGVNRIFMMISKASASANRIGQVLAAPIDQKVLSPEQAKKPAGDEFIRFEHVTFSYHEGTEGSLAESEREQCLYDISFALRKGESLGIIGPTGCGKTTIINLLMRFYDVDAGEIRVDGKELHQLTRSSLRRAYAMVLQDTWVFQGTIFENIAYGKEGATREEVVAAAKAARIHDYIMRLPDGYDTVISEDGGNISKGQKQLLTIARAMLYDTQMLILDEATSNVDTNTEQKVQKAMQELMRGKTSFVIAHRLSTIQNADKILVMEHGDVMEQGTHAELMARKGVYYKLYASQFE